MTTYVIVLACGAAALVTSVPGFLREVHRAPREFWVLAVVAVCIEVAPLVIPHEGKLASEPAVSLVLTFGMLLVWGSAVAIVVQALALGVAQLRTRRPLINFALNVARFSIAFVVAGWVYDWIGHGRATVGMTITGSTLSVILVTAAGWFLVDLGLITLLLTAGGSAVWRMWAGAPLNYYLATSAGLLLFSPVLITGQTGWFIALVVVPLALLGMISKFLLRYERNIILDPVSRQYNLVGLRRIVEGHLSTGSPGSAAACLGFLQVRIRGLDEVMNVFGRPVTEDLVKEVGARIAAETSGKGAAVGRVAATDFGVVLPGTDVEGARHAGDMLAGALLAPFDIRGVLFAIHASIGVATAPADGSDIAELTARAETAIMDARHQGALVQAVRNHDVVEATRRLELLIDLRAAIDKAGHAGELYVEYQPQVRISDGHLVGVEALVRWRHPERGLVGPGDMIMVAEASGVISLLTFRVLDEVLSQLAAWSAAGLRLRASVNVSAKDFGSPRFAEEVQLRLQRHSIAPEHLELEVTESALELAAPNVDQVVADLTGMGVGLSLDDFGTGFASIQQLRRYPLRELKIDRSYVVAMGANPADRAVVESITRLATDLGLRVVAEGVEDEATSAALGQIGPLIGQGWYFGRPMTAPDLVAWIRSRADAA